MSLSQALKIIPLTLAGVLVSGWLSPSLAVEHTKSLDWLWPETGDLPLVEGNGFSDVEQPLTRSDFIVSTVDFHRQLWEFNNVYQKELTQICLIHQNSYDFILERMVGSYSSRNTSHLPETLLSDVDRSIAVAYQVIENKRATRKSHSAQNSVVLLNHPMLSESGLQQKQSEQNSPEWESPPYNGNSTLYRLEREFGLELLQDDGTFQLGEPLRQEDYLTYMRQIEHIYNSWFLYLEDGTSFFTADPLAMALGHSDVIEANAALTNALDDLATVRSLLAKLRTLTDALIAQTTKDITKNDYLDQPSILAQRPQIYDVADVQDMPPDDPAYEPLQLILENYLIEGLLREDGRFDGQTPLTRGEFASYISQMLDAHFSILGTEVCGINTLGYISRDLTPSHQRVSRELQQRIEDLEIEIAHIENYR